MNLSSEVLDLVGRTVNLSSEVLDLAWRTVNVSMANVNLDGLNLIRLKNVKSRDAMRLAFDGGVLEMHCAYALRTEGMFSDNEIREALLAKL